MNNQAEFEHDRSVNLNETQNQQLINYLNRNKLHVSAFVCVLLK